MLLSLPRLSYTGKTDFFDALCDIAHFATKSGLDYLVLTMQDCDLRECHLSRNDILPIYLPIFRDGSVGLLVRAGSSLLYKVGLVEKIGGKLGQQVAQRLEECIRNLEVHGSRNLEVHDSNPWPEQLATLQLHTIYKKNPTDFNL